MNRGEEEGRINENTSHHTTSNTTLLTNGPQREGNTEEDTRLFADTVIKLNLQKLASITEGMSRSSGDGGNPPVM